MASKRQNILNYIKTILDGVTEIKYTEVQRTTPIDVQTVPFPAAFIYGGRENRLTDNNSVIGYETWEWPITIEVWGRDADMEDLLEKVHRQMFSGETMGGNAAYSYRTSAELLVIDPEQSLEAMLVEYNVIFRHPKGAMGG